MHEFNSGLHDVSSTAGSWLQHHLRVKLCRDTMLAVQQAEAHHNGHRMLRLPADAQVFWFQAVPVDAVLSHLDYIGTAHGSELVHSLQTSYGVLSWIHAAIQEHTLLILLTVHLVLAIKTVVQTHELGLETPHNTVRALDLSALQLPTTELEH